MSEYQRYEFMTVDKPLTPQQVAAVDKLSSHINVSSTHAIVEYNWGDFKHNPIKVLHDYFDGFLYWANWGSPQLAFRFPHGVLPADLIEKYAFDDFVDFTRQKDYDILDIHFGEMEPPDEWEDYELGSMIALREELMEGDTRSLYITWLADQQEGGYYEDEEDDEDLIVPPVPPNFGALTPAQKALANLLQVPSELLAAAAVHSSGTTAKEDDFAAWIELLPAERSRDYLLRLARNEPGLSRRLIKELRELGRGKPEAAPEQGERVPYGTLRAESNALKDRLLREQYEREQ